MAAVEVLQLIWINAVTSIPRIIFEMMEFAPMLPAKDGEWQPVSNAPFDRDQELAVIASGEAHALVFPCRRILNGWINAETKERLDVRPTHWREWNDG